MSDQGPRVPDMQKREALLVHIEGLQVSLTKRNQRIAELEELIAGEGASSFMQQRLEAERKRGWEECAHQLATITQDAARNLGRIRTDALRIYYEATDD